MTTWDLLQIVFNLSFLLVIYIFWVKLKRPPQDDPRLSRGLQLLQSKISVLEDLSDRTETQVEQLNILMDKKSRQVQIKIDEADKKMREIEQSMYKSLEVAEIFQDKIPHTEIIKRQDTVKYVRAAQMAYGGSSTEEIAKEVDLPTSEIEMIAKVNKDELMFDSESLPEWAKSEPVEAESYDSLKKLGADFREACEKYEEDFRHDTESFQRIVEAPGQVLETAKTVGEKVKDEAVKISRASQEMAENLASKLHTTMESPSADDVLELDLDTSKDVKSLEFKDLAGDTHKIEKPKVKTTIKRVLFPKIGSQVKRGIDK